MKPLNEKTKMPKKAVRVGSKKSVIEEDFITLGTDCSEIGLVTAIRSNISEVDVDAYYIKQIDEGKEKCVYLRKIGKEVRVFFAEKKSEGHIPFIPYALSEFSLNEMLLGRDRRANAEDIVLADRKIGENELEYISMFMPENHQLKRKKGISMALTNDEKYEFMAFYWKNGKSVPCANSSYIPVLFDALETVTFNNASLTSPEQAADEIALDTDEEDENETNEPEETAESDQADAEPEQETTIPEESDSKPEEPAKEAEEIVSESEESASVSTEEAAEQSAEAEPEEKPEKESLFEKRRKKKQLKKEQKANKKAKKAEKSKEEHSEEKEEIKQTEEIAESPAETDEEEISAEESEALAAAMPTDLFSEQELEDIFDNPFEDEIAEAEEAEQGETENQPEEEDDIAAESEEAEPDAEVEASKASDEAEKEKKPEKEGFFEKRRKKKRLKKAQKENDEKAQKPAEVAEETQPAEEPEQIAETESVVQEAEQVENPLKEEENLQTEPEQAEEAEEIKADLPEQAEQPQQAEPENEEASEENAEPAAEAETSDETEEKEPAKEEKSAKKGSLFAKKPNKKKSKKHKAKPAEESEEEIDLESEEATSEDEKKEKKFSVEEFFENEKPLTLLQILEAADINNENKKSFMPYMIPALMNTVYIVPITDNGENAGAVYVAKKAADLLAGQDFPLGKGKELIMPDDERENLRKGIKIKTIMSSGEAFIPAFTSAEMFEQIFGKNERAGLFAFPNLRSQIKKTEQIKGIIINPEITDLKLEEKEI